MGEGAVKPAASMASSRAVGSPVSLKERNGGGLPAERLTWVRVRVRVRGDDEDEGEDWGEGEGEDWGG